MPSEEKKPKSGIRLPYAVRNVPQMWQEKSDSPSCKDGPVILYRTNYNFRKYPLRLISVPRR